MDKERDNGQMDTFRMGSQQTGMRIQGRKNVSQHSPGK
jgi:hypothetical protein